MKVQQVTCKSIMRTFIVIYNVSKHTVVIGGRE